MDNIRINVTGTGNEALRMLIEYRQLKERATEFVGKSNCDYDGSPWGELSKKASQCVIEEAIAVLEKEEGE